MKNVLRIELNLKRNFPYFWLLSDILFNDFLVTFNNHNNKKNNNNITTNKRHMQRDSERKKKERERRVYKSQT